MYMSPHRLSDLIATAIPFPSGHLFHRRLTPETFVTAVSRLNSLAIQVHRTASLRSRQPEIQTYARQMAEGHIWLNEALLTACEASGTPKSMEYTPDIAQQKRLDDLQLCEAADFDFDYIRLQNQIYMEIVILCEQFSHRHSHDRLEIYALTMCNYLRFHLEQFAPGGAAKTPSEDIAPKIV
ncbi:DUF4142 domain-containing protein [Asticcacaulis sp. BYS171W]|uniref:DUF4142 domain-containing protein n=1 Tax=Asticcacaulis aquaticus TaxID=2984212 RepID=A0ABT5HX72_9CAUL|nr:DUF4142 domain-containing protein [Asticcacaulis aquaticus]MDC7684677.1 DUF4142 domain-containing protein [Asticcacaulis aquaticus]